jgi:hypothetical protein
MKKINSGFLEQYLTKLNEAKKFWHHALIHSRWIDNGKGGAMNSQSELDKVGAKIESIEYVLKNGANHTL